MSTISGVSGGRTGWQDVDNTRGDNTRGTARSDRMFAKVDSNGDGSVDGAELQSMLDKMAQQSGGTAANADAAVKTMDSDGNGTLDADELGTGMKSLMPPPASTLDFAQQRGDEDVRGADGPPPPRPDATDASSTDPADGLRSLLEGLFQAADTDGSGQLDTSELDTLKTNFDTAIKSLESGTGGLASASDGTSTSPGTTITSLGSGEATSHPSSGSSDSTLATLTALANLVLKEYAATAASSAAASPTAINLSA